MPTQFLAATLSALAQAVHPLTAEGLTIVHTTDAERTPQASWIVGNQDVQCGALPPDAIRSSVTQPEAAVFLPYLFLPLLASGEPVGIIELYHPHPAPQPSVEIPRWEEFARVGGLAVANALTAERYQAMAFRDLHTGARTYAWLLDYLPHAVASSLRDKRPFVIAAFDVDKMKRLNTAHGHRKVDLLLQALVESVRDELRACDEIVRYSQASDEFLLYLPNTPLENARQFVRRIQARLDDQPLILSSKEMVRGASPVGGESIRLSISVGAACFPDGGLDPNSVIEQALLAMLADKQRRLTD